MAQYLIQYIDHIDEDTKKELVLNGKDHDDVEFNLYRKTKCHSFTVLNIQELKGLYSK